MLCLLMIQKEHQYGIISLSGYSHKAAAEGQVCVCSGDGGIVLFGHSFVKNEQNTEQNTNPSISGFELLKC